MNEKEIKSDKGMPFHGVGPKSVILLIPFAIIIGIINEIYKPVFIIADNPILLIIVGILLLIVGVYIYLTSIIAIKKAYDDSRLLTSGFYSYVRHPVYSSFILFLTPGIICFYNSWILFIIPFILYIIFKIYIKQEEIDCLIKFGENYELYKNKINALIPNFKKYKNK